MEEEESLLQEYGIYYKIEPNHSYKVYRKDYNGQTYYNIMIDQKNIDNTKTRFYVPILFRKGVELQNETVIKIVKAIENARENKNLKESLRPYYPVFSYTITEFIEIEQEKQAIQDAYDDYTNLLNGEQTVSITDDFLD